MDLRKIEKWLLDKNIEEFNYISFVGYKYDSFIVELERESDSSNKKKAQEKIILEWTDIYSYVLTNETYREDLWISDKKEYWPFYKAENSEYINYFKNINSRYRDDEVIHFMIIGEEVLDILAFNEPKIIHIDGRKDVINKFDAIYGDYTEKILGNDRYGYSYSEIYDLYEIEELMNYQGEYKGDLIRFYDFYTKKVYEPFKLEKNIAYSSPYYLNDNIYFLRSDFKKGILSIYSYIPDFYLDKVVDFNLENINLYNISIIGEDLYLTSSSDKFEIYYPFRKTIILEPNESVMFIKDKKLYISKWIEENWDEEINKAGEGYKFYEKFIIKDLDGKIISEELGNLFQHNDGTWWLS